MCLAWALLLVALLNQWFQTTARALGFEVAQLALIEACLKPCRPVQRAEDLTAQVTLDQR